MIKFRNKICLNYSFAGKKTMLWIVLLLFLVFLFLVCKSSPGEIVKYTLCFVVGSIFGRSLTLYSNTTYNLSLVGLYEGFTCIWCAILLVAFGLCCCGCCLAKSFSKKNTTEKAIGVGGSPPVVITPMEKHTATLIFFHGLGDQANGWADTFQSEFRSRLKHFKFVIPNAADRPVTLNFGMRMPAWFDLKGLSPDVEEDAAGIHAATKYVHSLIDAEMANGIPSDRIFLGGFSMGAALAIYAGLTYESPLGGIVSFSGFLLRRSELPGSSKANLSTPIFMGHGRNDPLVPFQFGRMTEESIKKFNPNVTLRDYPVDHTTSATELMDAVTFLDQHTGDAGVIDIME